ncbi:hypothetical protein [Roseovarius sp.]|uniref:hypothetical protein n=1 Tax=Roseovarius sp. TaxID=1486281 RepID=UPI003BAD4058
MTRPAIRDWIVRVMVFSFVALLFVAPTYPAGIWRFHDGARLDMALGAGVGETVLNWVLIPGIVVDWGYPNPAACSHEWNIFAPVDLLTCFD